MANKKTELRVSILVSTYLKILHQEGNVGIRELWRRYPNFALSTIYRHATSKIHVGDASNNKKIGKRSGRKKLLCNRDERSLMRSLRCHREMGLPVTSKRLQVASCLTHVSNRTVRRTLNAFGYNYLQARRKGLMSHADLKKRCAFAKNIIRLNINYTLWTNNIAFYLDGTTWVFKTNPFDQACNAQSRVWRKPCEGLQHGCTSKGKKVGYGGKSIHFLVSISYSKGVISCEQYNKMNGEFFASFIRTKFKVIFQCSNNPDSNLFLQDGDPSQNSKAATNELAKLGFQCFSIPPRSPDCNPIENLFNLVDMQLRSDAISQQITKETEDEFAKRVRNTITAFPIKEIDKIIDTMPKRMHMLVQNKGQRLKY